MIKRMITGKEILPTRKKIGYTERLIRPTGKSIKPLARLARIGLRTSQQQVLGATGRYISD